MTTKQFKDEVSTLFSDSFTRQKTMQMVNRLKRYNIHTAEQFYGAINPMLPDITPSEQSEKGLQASFFKAKKKVSSPNYKTKQIKNILSLTSSEARSVVNTLDNINLPVQAFKTNRSSLSLGLLDTKTIHRSQFWPAAKFKKGGDEFVIPDYSRMGAVFDQGTRGTCVANACCSLIDYLAGDKSSRQFLYHQCKMVDNIAKESGTYIDSAMGVLIQRDIRDFGVVPEKCWRYNPSASNSEAQGPPPEVCYSCSRHFGNTAIYARHGSMVSDIKNLLLGSDSHVSVPVVIGVRLFSSFQNPSSNRTGWITMPLPGESTVGGHAMLVVGYYEQERLFLVRNSWGTSWAPENPRGNPGHALMPYDYISQHCHSAVSLPSTTAEFIDVPENMRLYRRNVVITQSRFSISKKTSSRKFKDKSVRRKRAAKAQQIVKFVLFMLIGAGVVLSLLFFEEIMEFFDYVQSVLKK